MRTLGDYGYYAEPSLITKDMGSVSGPNPQAANISRKRIVILKEPEAGARITSFYKSLTGGGQLNARKCHSNDTTVYQDLTLCCECNTRFMFKETPQVADYIRIKDILFDSNFTHHEDDYDQKLFVPDPTLKTTEWQDSHRMSFMWILIDHYRHFRDAKYRIDTLVPESVRQRSKQYLEQNNPISGVFDIALEKAGAADQHEIRVAIREVVKHIKYVARQQGYSDIQCRDVTRESMIRWLLKHGHDVSPDGTMLRGYQLQFE
jgi:phage/plasmid-associated DNA primase